MLKKNLRKRLDTIVDPQNKHTIVDQIVISSEKKSIDQVKKTKKVKKHFSKGKGKGNVWKNTPQTTAGQNSGPPPHNKHII